MILADKRHEVRLGRRQETDGAKLYRLRSLVLILRAMNSHCKDFKRRGHRIRVAILKDGYESFLVESEQQGNKIDVQRIIRRSMQ